MYQLLASISRAFSYARTWFMWLAGATRDTALPSWFYQALHALLVIATVVLFGAFSPWITDPNDVKVSDAPFIQKHFWGFAVLLLYLLIRVAIFVIRLLLEREEEFDDIRRAWDAGMAALDRVGLDIQWLPVFIVVGAGEEEDALFRAARMSWKTTAPGREDAAPVRIYATEEAIFISCTGTGALAAQRTTVLEPAVGGGMDRTQRPTDGISHSETIDPGSMGARAPQGGGIATIDPSSWSAGGAEAAPRPAAYGTATGTMVAPGAASGTLLPGGGGSGILAGLQGAAKSTAAGPIRPLAQAELDLANRRLEYLCGLVTKARGEFCPINGMLLVLPLAWAGLPAGADTDRIARSAREDVETAYRGFGLAFPTTVAITGFERTPGLRQFVERGMRLNPKFLDSRAGSKFPPGAAIDQNSARWAVDAGLQWFRDWCYSLFSQNLSDSTNGPIYRLLCELQTRRDALTRQLQLTFEGVSGADATRLSGVYYCAAGRSERDRAFVQGVFRKLVDGQDDVAWTADRLRTDANRRSMAVAGLVLAIVLIAVVGYL
ncbi:MAG: hypothetical protein M3552_09075, partial [Planctomycetota bacterium]|nr:hypothetical protein [Planctomycetota bacterium]